MNSKRLLILFLTFASIISCKKTDPNKQIDEGKFDNYTYTSAEIGWTINVPKDWEITSREENEEHEKKGLEVIEKMVDGEIDASAMKNLIGFQKNKSNSFMSTSEPFLVENSGDWKENNAMLKVLLYDTYKSQGIKVDSSKTTTINIDGLDFESFEYKIYDSNGALILNQLMYSRIINGLDFGVVLNYNNQADKKEMLNAWLNSKFIK